MHGTDRQECYRAFIECVEMDLRKERKEFNRRVLHVLIWCFVLPTFTSALLLILMRAEIIPYSYHRSLEWLVPFFPVVYSLYVLISEVVPGLPQALKRGGMATTLQRSLQETEWRAQLCVPLRKVFRERESDRLDRLRLQWARANFSMDIDRLKQRTWFLTALAGAVFFFIMRGIDSFSETAPRAVIVKNPVFGWVDIAPNDWAQFLGLGAFLVLLYLSGTQAYLSLLRYLNCLELLLLEAPEVRDPERV